MGVVEIPSGARSAPASKSATTASRPAISMVPTRAVAASANVIVSGESIGVTLKTPGLLVVGFHPVHTGKGTYSPAEAADIHVGDLLFARDGKTIDPVSLEKLVQQAGMDNKPLHLRVKRGDKKLDVQIAPAKEANGQRYQLGLWLKDAAVGVGTLTFIDPSTHRFAALGHQVSDPQTGQPVPVGSGKIVAAKIVALEKGERGQPGEKQGEFLVKSPQIGTVTENTEFGIFGKITDDTSLDWHRTVPIATPVQVHPGPATLRTVVRGEKIEDFQVEIISVMDQRSPASKGLALRVTDPKLLHTSGGIIQGMSGSPILQDGRLVGAVTHVFVNDPTRGYGVLAQWMYEQVRDEEKAA